MNLGDQLNVLNIIPIASVTGDGNGSGVDLQGYEGEMAVILDCVNTAGTTPTMDIKLQHSDDNSSYSDVTGGAFAQVTDAGASVQKLSLNSDELKRYIRAVKDIGGTSSPAFLVSVKGVVFKKYQS